MLKSYKVILWDFDGVIMDSMTVRDKGFEVVLQNYPAEQVALLMEYHKKNGGLSRYHKFRYFFEEIRKESVSDDDIKDLANEFSKIMLNNLLDPDLLINDSLQFIKDYHSKFKMHIVSGSDEKELNYICESLNISKYFISIHGSPTPKKELVKQIIESEQYVYNQICLIGDSVNDYEAAVDNEITFVGYNSPLLKTQKNYYIESFKKLYS